LGRQAQSRPWCRSDVATGVGVGAAAGRRGPVATAKAIALPVAYSAPFWIGLVLGHGGALAATVNLVSGALAPTFLFIALRDEGPSVRITAGRPRSGR